MGQAGNVGGDNLTPNAKPHDAVDYLVSAPPTIADNAFLARLDAHKNKTGGADWLPNNVVAGIRNEDGGNRPATSTLRGDQIPPAPVQALDLSIAGTSRGPQPESPAPNPDGQVGGTSIRKDSSGNITEYHNNGFTLSKHNDGWYAHEDKGGDFIKVNADTIKMDSTTGQVKYDESTLFGKGGATLGGNGGGGLLGAVEGLAHDGGRVIGDLKDGNISGAMHDGTKTVQDAGTNIGHAAKEIGKNVLYFDEAAITGVTNDAAKYANQLFGTHYSTNQRFSNQDDVENSLGGKLGKFSATVATDPETVLKTGGNYAKNLVVNGYHAFNEGLTDGAKVGADLFQGRSSADDLRKMRHDLADAGYGMAQGLVMQPVEGLEHLAGSATGKNWGQENQMQDALSHVGVNISTDEIKNNPLGKFETQAGQIVGAVALAATTGGAGDVVAGAGDVVVGGLRAAAGGVRL
jgi:hypothetical protein